MVGRKCVVVGNTGVGKSSFVHRLQHNTFPDIHNITVGVAYSHFSLGGNELHLWDTGGYDNFKSIIPLYYRDIDCAIIMFDIASIQNNASGLIDLITEQVATMRLHRNDNHAGLAGLPDHTLPILLVGTKTDTAPAAAVKKEQELVNHILDDLSLQQYVRVSSKTESKRALIKKVMPFFTQIFSVPSARESKNHLIRNKPPPSVVVSKAAAVIKKHVCCSIS